MRGGHEGTGPPPHNHEWDVASCVIKRSVEFAYRGKTMVAVPGMLVQLPAGTVRDFRYVRVMENC